MAFGSMNSGDDSPMSDINVTPLVDVMLVLLIVFMITMPVLTHSIPLELPTASEQTNKQDKQPKDPLRLTIDANGFSDVRHQRYAVGGRDAGVADCVYDYYAGADAFHPFGTADRVRADKQAGQTA